VKPMFPVDVTTLQADALFASALQRSDELSPGTIRQAVAATLDAYGGAGCAGRVAQEFGDHPESAAARMCWARAAVAVLGGQLVPRMRRMADPDSWALGKNPVTGLSAIRSA
jgi:hypothetical protein